MGSVVDVVVSFDNIVIKGLVAVMVDTVRRSVVGVSSVVSGGVLAAVV